MSKVFTRGSAMAALIAASLAAPQVQAADDVSLTFAHMMPTANPQHACGVVSFEDSVKAAATGLALTVFPAGQTQKDSVEQIEALMTGVIDFTMASPAQVGTQLDKFSAFDLVYLFRDQADMLDVMRGPVAKAVFDELIEKSGIRILAVGYAGTRHLTANREIRTPEDLSGMKLRVVNAPIWIDNGKALGGTPTPVSFGELYLALQQGVVDAQENPLPTIATSHFDEVQKFVMLTGHNIAPALLLMSEETWQRLSPDQQATVDAAAAQWADGVSTCTAEQEAQYLADWSAEGARMKVIADVDRDAFIERAKAELMPVYGEKWDGLYKRILEAR